MVAFYDLPRCTPPQPGHDGEESQRGLFGGFYQKSTTRTTRRRTAEQAVGAPRDRCMLEGLEEVERRVGAVGHVVAASGGRGH